MKRMIKAVIDEKDGKTYVIVSRTKIDRTGEVIYLGEKQNNF